MTRRCSSSDWNSFGKDAFFAPKDGANMESIIFRVFGVIYQAVGLLILTGLTVAVLTDLQHHAFVSKQSGLTSMLKINEQLVGPESPVTAAKIKMSYCRFLDLDETCARIK